MISEAFAKKQLERLSQLPGFGVLLKEALIDMRHAIQAADTEEIAERVITDFCGDSAEYCPTAAAVRRAMNNENDRGKPTPLEQEHQQWRGDPISRISGAFERGRFPALDRHLELLDEFAKAKRDSKQWHSIKGEIEAIQETWK